MDCKQIISNLGLRLNTMQKATHNALLKTENDVVVLSPTGTGKTYAYLLPLVEKIDTQRDDLQAIVVLPSRELAQQSADVLRDIKSGVRGFACYGGRAAMDEHRQLRETKPHIVFGTPGRLIDHLEKGNLMADDVELLVIDEFDKCLELGFQHELSQLLSLLPHLKRKVLLSATNAEEIPSFVNLDRAQLLDYLPKDGQESNRLQVFELRSGDKDKLEALTHLLCYLGQESSIVFLNYRESVERTCQYLRERGFTISDYHGGQDQKSREEALFLFSNGSTNILVSTDLGSRGLDIPHVENIIHYHLPETQAAYTHRVGRTARWDASGRTIFLLGPEESIPDYVDGEVTQLQMPDKLPLPAQPKMATIYIGKGKKDKLSKTDVVGFLCKKGGLNGKEIGRIDLRDHYIYVAVNRKRLKELLRNVQGEKIKGMKTIVEEISPNLTNKGKYFAKQK